MANNFEFSINEKTLEKIFNLKKKMGLEEKSWDSWFNQIIDLLNAKKFQRNDLESVMKKVYDDQFYEKWVQNFALNLHEIWNESSAKNISEQINSTGTSKKSSAIVIGRGPSIKKYNHLELLAKSDYNGTIVCCDGALIATLKAGVTPEKFPNFYVVTIDTDKIIKNYYNDPLVDKFGKKINGIFSVVVDPSTVQRARDAKIKIHWLHALFDYNEGKKSFNQISALMVRAKNHQNGLPAIQTGGNVGTAAWFAGWQILKHFTIGLIGINHSWDEDEPWETIISHCKIPREIKKESSIFKQMFPKVYNPEFKCNCIMDPLFLYYSNAFKDFIKRSPTWLTTINATEGGCLFGGRINCMTLEHFLKERTN